MTTFPVLRTGALSQYPLRTQQEYRIAVIPYIDGSEQRFESGGRCIRRWVVELNQLDALEAHRIREFFRAQRARAGLFAFVDPISGTTYPRCCFDHDEFTVTAFGDDSAATQLVIRALED